MVKYILKKVLESKSAERILSSVFRQRTLKDVKFDLRRLYTRIKNHYPNDQKPEREKLHFGCGRVKVSGWLNVDVKNSDYDIDLGCGSLPWKDESFKVIASQQTIEHLELHQELIPLLEELNRVAIPGAEMWLACPNMERVCKSYIEYKGRDLLKDRQTRAKQYKLRDECPPQQMINNLFHQKGEHKNLFDFELLKYALKKCGFTNCAQVSEEEFNSRFPKFPQRGDEYVSLYVKAVSK